MPAHVRVLVTYGTRPEVIKLVPVIRVLSERPERFSVVLCCTAQHRQLIDDLHEFFRLEPDHNLGLMRPNQRLSQLAGEALTRLDDVLQEVEPTWVIVQGDTTTAMAMSVAAFHCECRVAHVEAGLRTGDLRAPFPEEANRRIIDSVADLLFAPTFRARDALLSEGHDTSKIAVVGNTGIDALKIVADGLPLEATGDEVLVTVHRRESFGAPLIEILAALRDLASSFAQTRWVFPVHPNPNVAGPVRERLDDLNNVVLCEPLRYDKLIRHMQRARLVLTDSGGIQEEAPFFGKPVLVLRETTERPEGVDAGVARLVGTRREDIVRQTSLLLNDPVAYRKMARNISPYGDGRAAERIAAVLAGEAYQPFEPSASS